MGIFLPPQITTAQRTILILSDREIVYDLNEKKFYYGNGTTIGGLPFSGSNFDGLYTSLIGIPTTFTPSAHVHPIADVTGLQPAIDAKAPIANPSFIGTVSGITKAMVGLSNVDNTTDIAKPISTAQAAADTTTLNTAKTYTDTNVNTLKDGVTSAGDSLQKLYNLIIANIREVTVATIAARNAYNVLSLPFNIFVTNDGDGNWALYKATSTGVGASFVKLSDPDLLNALMTSLQIKTSYESSPDTNAFTNALLAKLNAITGTNTGDDATNSQYLNDYRLANFIAGTNYLAPNGSAAALTSFPTLKQNTTGSATTITSNLPQSQITNLVTDLGNLLVKNSLITAATKTKITYDAKGLVLFGIDATTSDFADTSLRRFVTDAQISTWNSLIGGSVFQTAWNANTNTPTLASGVGTKGYYYIVTTDGSTNLDGILDWKNGDWAIFDGTVWRKVDNTDAVITVNGLIGTVLLTSANVPDSSNKRYITDSQLAILAATIGINTGDNAINSLYASLVSNATHTGDVVGATSTVVKGINSVLLSSLGTGILKNTTITGVPSIATGADLPTMTNVIGGAVPTPPNDTTKFLRGDGTFALPTSTPTEQPVISVTTNQNINTNIFYNASAANGNIILTLINPTNLEITTVKKVDTTSNSIFVQSNSLIDDGLFAELTVKNESISFKWTGTTYEIF